MSKSNNKKPFIHNKNNIKRMLCINIIRGDECPYGETSCIYAHSLSQQKLDDSRAYVYNILKSTGSLSHINLVNDEKRPSLYKEFLELTLVCQKCKIGKCPGGYNCHNGALSYKYKICYDDITSGKCRRSNCNAIHLTDRGLIPYEVQKGIDNNTKCNITKKWNIQPEKNIVNNLVGIRLTPNYFYSKLNNKYDTSSDSENSSEEERMMNYLNNYTTSESDDSSITIFD